MTDLEKRADEYVSNKADKGNFDVEKFGRAYFSESSMKQALINFAKAETALLSQHILDLQKDKGNLTDRVRELEQQIEKLIDFVLSKTECCDVCPITDTCINSEGTCPYAGILSKGEEAVTREWLMQKIAKEINTREWLMQKMQRR